MKETEVFRHKKSLGQNFLEDRTILEKIVKTAVSAPGDVILEIGAGKGVLSKALLAASSSILHSVEIDRDLQPFLERLKRLYEERFILHWADALRMDFRELIPAPRKVIANIPYYITTPLLWRLMEAATEVRYLLVMVQKEAASRILSPPGTKDRGPLGVTIGAMGAGKILFTVPRGAFRPAPAVDSCLLEIILEGERRSLAADEQWRDMLSAGFAQRRKKLMGNLASDFKEVPWRELFAKGGIDENSRAENLTTDEWVFLFEQAKKEWPPPRSQGKRPRKN
ncbi:MAG: 16S rRNA (adenine(1518)-N(6)/adenine(1519)-N(6))-dimethyltransferase RsmA [Aminivibrio sp.]